MTVEKKSGRLNWKQKGGFHTLSFFSARYFSPGDFGDFRLAFQASNTRKEEDAMSTVSSTPTVGDGVSGVSVAVNVDYAATGQGHLDRYPCRISVVTNDATLVDVLVSVEPLHSAMTPYTGVTAEEIRAAGVPLADAVAAVHAALTAAACGGRVVLVGYNTTKLCGWLSLERGVHYSTAVDLVELTRTWNRRFGHWNFYSLAKICYAIFGEEAAMPNSLARATSLYDVYALAFSAPFAVADLRKKLQKLQYGKEFPDCLTSKPVVCDSVCVWAYNDGECICDQPTLERGGADLRNVNFGARALISLSLSVSPVHDHAGSPVEPGPVPDQDQDHVPEPIRDAAEHDPAE